MLQYSIRFIFGYLLGSIVWLVVIGPYKRYYDFTYGHYWPQVVFSLVMALIFMASLVTRSTMALFLPNMLGGATQNYIIILLLTSLLVNPLGSVGYNSVESVRVIGCSLVLTFDQLSERAKLVLNPIFEILSDQTQADFDPIRQDLVRIQQFVGEIKKNAQLIGSSQISVAQTNKTMVQNITNRRTGTSKATSNQETTSKTGIQLEWDPENFGVRANVDLQKVRSLAKAGKLQEYLGQDLTTTNTSLKLRDILFASCINMFHEAKNECHNSVVSMGEACKRIIGPHLATLWCQPFEYSLESFCPWVMNQLVDERSLCKQIKLVEVNRPLAIQLAKSNTTNENSQQSVDVNEAFNELNRQISHLNENMLLDDNDSDATNKRPQLAGKRLQRLEIHLTFNEQTRRIFRATKSVIEFISDKYRLRRFLIKALLLAYDVYTTYTFLLIMIRAWRYRRAYLTDIKFDNCYITSAFKRLDGRRPRSSAVLPLRPEEERHYITTLSCRRRTHEQRQAQRASLTLIAVFLAFTLSLLYLDDIFYSLLASIHDHSLIRYKEFGHHQLEVRVRGEGVMARLVRRLAGHLSSVHNLDRYTSTRECLPEARHTPTKFYFEFLALCTAYFLIDQISIYAMRLRRATCALFYPEQERQRVHYLHKLIQFKRHKLATTNFESKIDDDDDDENKNTNNDGNAKEAATAD